MTKKTRRRRVGAEEFVTAWQTSTDISEVALKLYEEETETGDNLRLALSTRACLFRRRGIPLKSMQGGNRKGLDIASLADLAKGLAKENS
mgnify:CR=1 FL=1